MAENNNKINSTIKELEQEIENQKNETSTVQQPNNSQEWWSTTEAMTISSIVLAFGFTTILIMGYLLGKGQNADDILKLFGTIIIIISAVFLVVAGYSDQQISPVMGLLGTIAGYLLAKDVKTEKSQKNKEL